MKRFVIAVILMIIMVSVGVVSLWHVIHTRDTLSAQVLHIQNNALDNPEDSMRELSKLVDMWSKRNQLLAHHVRHRMMEDVSKALSRASVYAEEGEKIKLRAELAELYWLFHGIYEDEQITLSNIF
jgi:hypothetical protein